MQRVLRGKFIVMSVCIKNTRKSKSGCVHLKSQNEGGRGSWVSVNLRSSWSPNEFQSKLHNETLSQKKEEKEEGRRREEKEREEEREEEEENKA